MNIGRITQVLGPVVDVAFDSDHLPEIRTALKMKRRTGGEIVIHATGEGLEPSKIKIHPRR